MRTKILRIENCYGCPFSKPGHFKKFYCSNPVSDVGDLGEYDNLDTIHPDCPLEDAPKPCNHDGDMVYACGEVTYCKICGKVLNPQNG